MNISPIKELDIKTDSQKQINQDLRTRFVDLLPYLGDNWHMHALIGVRVQALARVNYYTELYKQIANVPGVICEFGVQWGATMCQLINLRSIYEPFNISRKIIGFDTFSGFPSVSVADFSRTSEWKPGDYSSKAGFESDLEQILWLHEQAAPMAHIRKFDLVKGDICKTFPVWLEENPHAIISMAIFDTDLYLPTRDVLQLIKHRLTRGSILVFDELNCEHFPGETIAVREILGTENLKLRRTHLQPYCSWAVWGE